MPAKALDPNGAFDTASRQLNELWATTQSWFQQHFLQILIGLAAGTVIVLVLIAVRGLGARLCRRDQHVTGWATIVGRAIDRTGTSFMVAVAAKLVDGYAQPPEVVEQTINFIFIIVSVIQVTVWTREIILGFVEHRTAAGEHDALGSALNIIRVLVSVALFIIAGIVILDNLGVNVTGLIAGLGIGGIAIGLAAQGIFADLFAALSILFDRPFRKGDSIGFDDTRAAVEAIGLKSTRLRSITGEQRIISNKNLLDKEILNNTRLQYRRAKFALGLIYQLDIETAQSIPGMLQAIVEENGARFVRSGFVGFGDSSINFEVEFDVESHDFQDFYDARHRVGLAILQRMNEEKIDFAYPSQTTFTASPDGHLIMPYPEVQKTEMRVKNGKLDAPPRT